MSFFTNDDKIEEIRDIRRESSKPKPKKAAEDEINPIWDTLLKVVLNVTRIKGDMKVTKLDKFIKESNFNLRKLTYGKPLPNFAFVQRPFRTNSLLKSKAGH